MEQVRKGRRKGGGKGRAALLDSAARHFAERGYEGTSLRDISAGAGTQMGLIHYHFESKAELFREVLALQSEEINEVRRDALSRCLHDAAGAKPALDDLVTAWVDSVWVRSVTDDAWRDHFRILYQIAARPDRLSLSATYLERTNEEYLRWQDVVCSVLPGAEPQAIFNAFRMMGFAIMGTIVHVTSLPHDAAEVERRRRALVLFCRSGIEEAARSW